MDIESEEVIGSYLGVIDKIRLSPDGTECKIIISCDMSQIPENTAAWIREIVQNPCYCTIGAYDGQKDIGKGKVGRPKGSKGKARD
jgi:hypothetical protein